MEDAMILNKSAFERGFGHGSIYKAEVRGQHLRGVSELSILDFTFDFLECSLSSKV